MELVSLKVLGGCVGVGDDDDDDDDDDILLRWSAC
jgi:hypothetical protein